MEARAGWPAVAWRRSRRKVGCSQTRIRLRAGKNKPVILSADSAHAFFASTNAVPLANFHPDSVFSMRHLRHLPRVRQSPPRTMFASFFVPPRAARPKPLPRPLCQSVHDSVCQTAARAITWSPDGGPLSNDQSYADQVHSHQIRADRLGSGRAGHGGNPSRSNSSPLALGRPFGRTGFIATGSP